MRSMVEGAPDSTTFLRRQPSGESDAPSTAQTRGPPPPLSRGRISKFVLAARQRPSQQCTRKKASLKQSEGSGAPTGASIHWPCLRGTAARLALTGRARLSALHCGACRSDRTLRLSPGRASRAREDAGITAPSTALKRSTSHAGHNAGRVDARTARERGYKPRPQEPHSPHQSAVTGDAPR